MLKMHKYMPKDVCATCSSCHRWHFVPRHARHVFTT